MDDPFVHQHASLSWEVDIPLISNPLMVGAWVKAMGAVYLVAMLFLGVAFVGTGEADALLTLAPVFALVVLGFLVVGLLIMLLIFGNRFRARFTLSPRGIRYEGIDRRARALARSAVVLGAAAGNPSATGAGLTAVGGEQVNLEWSGAFQARYLPRRRVIRIRNQWRDLLQIYCTPDTYEAACDFVAGKIAARGTQQRLHSRPAYLSRALLLSGALLLGHLPLFALTEVTGLDLMIPLLMLAFALATLWLIPLFAWVVLPLIGLVVVHLILQLTELREYTLINTYRYRVFEALDGAEWAVVISACLSLIGIAWLMLRAVRGKLVPVLVADQS